MVSKTPLLWVAASATVLAMGCTEPRSPTAAATKAQTTTNRDSRDVEYRKAITAYAAGRHTLALGHFRAAAEQGSVNAQYYTGLMYANGEGTERNFDEAAKWYQQAVEGNHPDAMIGLARLYVTGSGVDRDAKQALALFGRAAKTFPPGKKKDEATEQRKALAAVLASIGKPAGP